MLPYVLAHETAHHLRHRAGVFSEDLWHEEQVANQLALAVVKPRLTAAQRDFARRVLPTTLEKLEASFDAKDAAADSYHNVLAGLQATGDVSTDTVKHLQLLGHLTQTNSDELLARAEGISPLLRSRLDRRSEVIGGINAAYTSDYTRYVYYQLGWFHLGLTSRETEYVEGFARKHLGWSPSLLPQVDIAQEPDATAIRACYQAAQEFTDVSAIGHSYFYKRYRASLLRKLRDAPLSLPQPEMSQSIRLVLDGWKVSDSDPLVYVAHFVADPQAQALFPSQLAASTPVGDALDNLPTETDRRIYRYLKGTTDELAEATVRRLTLLESSDILRELPAETLLSLAHSLVRVRLKAGEAVMRQDDTSDDVFLLASGRLAVVGENAPPDAAPWAVIGPGDVFGEMAFFTGEARSATVRAMEDAECFVLQGAELRLLAMDRPSILHQMGAALARRLAQANAKLTAPTPTRQVAAELSPGVDER
jgi:hypothetical protein